MKTKEEVMIEGMKKLNSVTRSKEQEIKPWAYTACHADIHFFIL